MSKMATRLERRSTISLPLPSLSASLKSATSITPLRSLASASLPMILLILSPISLSPLSATMSAKLPPAGTSIRASFWPAYLSETYLTNSRTRT